MGGDRWPVEDLEAGCTAAVGGQVMIEIEGKVYNSVAEWMTENPDRDGYWGTPVADQPAPGSCSCCGQAGIGRNTVCSTCYPAGSPHMCGGVVKNPVVPVPNDRPAVWDLVIDDLRDGLVAHKLVDDPLLDSYWKALDLVVYLRQEIEDRAENRAATQFGGDWL